MPLALATLTAVPAMRPSAAPTPALPASLQGASSDPFAENGAQ